MLCQLVIAAVQFQGYGGCAQLNTSLIMMSSLGLLLHKVMEQHIVHHNRIQTMALQQFEQRFLIVIFMFTQLTGNKQRLQLGIGVTQDQANIQILEFIDTLIA